MPALLILLIPLITAVSSSLKNGTKNALEGRYNGTFLYVLLGVVGYLIVNGWNKSKAETYLNNAGTDTDANIATRIYQALYGGGYMIPLVGYVGTTDEQSLYQAGAEIKDFGTVANAYKAIYNRQLTNDLTDQLNAQELKRFWDLVYKRLQTTPVVTIPTTTTTPKPTTPTTTAKKPGKGEVMAKQTVNVRSYSSPKNVLSQAKPGDIIGKYVGEKTLAASVTGLPNSYRFLIIDIPSFFGLSFVRVLVLKDSCTIGV